MEDLALRTTHILIGCAFALAACTGADGSGEVTPADLAGGMDDVQGCGFDAPCPVGLECITGICVVPCGGAEDCPAGVCYPLPGSAQGWCGPASGGGGGAPAPGGDNGAPPPPGGDNGGDPGGPPDKPEPPAGEDPPDSQDPPPGGDDPGPAPNDPPPTDRPDDPPPPDAPPPDAPPNEPPPTPEQCRMPWAEGDMQLGRFMKALSWRGATDGRGQRVDLDLEQIYCDQTYDTITFVIGAGWCGACPDYHRSVAQMAAGIEAANGLIVWVQTEDNSYNPATNDQANGIVNRYIPGTFGIRVGDGQTQPRPSTFAGSPIVPSYPSGFQVRVSDMRIIASNAQSNNVLQFDQIARDPNRLWHGSANCGAGDEEPQEPNDSALEPARIGAGTFSGGICGSDLDFYYVDIQGSWRFDLQFRHGTGDIDTYVWDAETNSPLLRGGEKVGSDSGNDNESFTHSGPAIVMVYGYQMQTSPYTLTVTEQ